MKPLPRESPGETLAYAAYDVAMGALAVPGALVAGVGALSSARWRPGMLERAGWVRPEVAAIAARAPRLWVHAASIGEVRAAHPLLAAARRAWPAAGILLTTTTPEGHRTASSLGLADGVSMLPLDLPGAPGRVLDAVRPDLLVLLETELWPGLLRAARRRLVPVVVVNGRISARSFGRYARVRPLLAPVLADVSAFAMQAEVDHARILALGADPARVETHGNLKYDALALPQPSPPRALAVLENETVFVAGSTHEGEEAVVADAFLALRESIPGLRLLVAPRHRQRADDAARALASRGLEVVRRSALPDPGGAVPRAGAAILLDSSGELAGVYALASAVFVGGSLVPVGGHNPLEPLAHGRPVAFGPYMMNFEDVAAVVRGAGGGVRVHDAGSLVAAIEPWLKDAAAARRIGEAAREAIVTRHGAAAKAIPLLTRFLGAAGAAPGDRSSPLGRPFGPPATPAPAEARPRAESADSRLAADAFPPVPTAGRADWLELDRRPGLRLAARIAERAYRAAVSIRGAAWDLRILPASRARIPVISVGGIAAGGTGKTPAVIWLANRLAASGHRVAVVSRGYGGRPGPAPRVVSPGSWNAADPHHAHAGATRPPASVVGDEPLLIAARAPSAAVVVHPDRVAGADVAESLGAQVILLDDGFQHRRLARDLDVVLLDAAEPFGNGHLLPAGSLRDLPSRVAAADLVLLTRAAEAGEGAIARAAAKVGLLTDAPVAAFSHRLAGFERVQGTLRLAIDRSALAMKRPYAFAGIASPEGFFSAIQRAGVVPVGLRGFSDHRAYTPAEIADLEREARAAGAEVLLTTEKDAVRLPATTLPLYVAVLDFEPRRQADAAAVDGVLARLPIGARPADSSPAPSTPAKHGLQPA